MKKFKSISLKSIIRQKFNFSHHILSGVLNNVTQKMLSFFKYFDYKILIVNVMGIIIRLLPDPGFLDVESGFCKGQIRFLSISTLIHHTINIPDKVKVNDWVFKSVNPCFCFLCYTDQEFRKIIELKKCITVLLAIASQN